MAPMKRASEYMLEWVGIWRTCVTCVVGVGLCGVLVVLVVGLWVWGWVGGVEE